MSTPPSSESSPLAVQQSEAQQVESERMYQVTLLMRDLFAREQATIKAILVCLLDVGIINFANNRIQFRPLRAVVKPVARASKPVLAFFAYRWFVKNCPPLIVNWLGGKVRFAPKPPRQPLKPATAVVVEPAALYQQEIRRLRSQVKVATGALVCVSAVLVLTMMGVDLKSLSQGWQASLRESSAQPSSVRRSLQSH